MRCEDFEIRMHEAFDERRAPLADAALAEHAAACDACRDVEAAIARAVRELAAEQLPVPNADLATKVVGGLEADGWPTSSGNEPPVLAASIPAMPRRHIIATLIATAAAVLLACYLYWGDGTSRNDKSEVAVVTPTAVEPAPMAPTNIAPLPTFTELAQEQKNSYAQLARDTARSFNDAWSVASVFGGSAGPAVVEVENDRPWLREVGGGLSPITESTLGTLDVLRSLVPSQETRS